MLRVGAGYRVHYLRHDAIDVCLVSPYTPVGELAGDSELGRVVEDLARYSYPAAGEAAEMLYLVVMVDGYIGA